MPQPAPFTNARAFVKGAQAIKQNAPAYAGAFCLKSPGRSQDRSRALLEQNLYRLFGGEEVLFGLVPAHNIPPGFQVVRPSILVEKVIGVFPNIDS